MFSFTLYAHKITDSYHKTRSYSFIVHKLIKKIYCRSYIVPAKIIIKNI